MPATAEPSTYTPEFIPEGDDTSGVIQSILDSIDVFPDRVWVLASGETFCGWAIADLNARGLACFSSKEQAEAFAATFSHGFFAIDLNFDTARDIALQRTPQLNALFLLDDVNEPQIFWLS